MIVGGPASQWPLPPAGVHDRVSPYGRTRLRDDQWVFAQSSWSSRDAGERDARHDHFDDRLDDPDFADPFDLALDD